MSSVSGESARPAGLLLLRDPVFAKHDWPGHPENALRLEAVDRVIADDIALSTVATMPAPAIDMDVVHTVHSDDHVRRLERLAATGGGWIDGETYCTAHSPTVAGRAAGATVEAALAVARGDATHSFALVRPPGHHATPSQAMGFCLFNNVAIATRAVQREQGIGRIAILDIDVHHGNGTQDVFYDDSDVLYVSLHQGSLYPGTGSVGERGEGSGSGATLNLPMAAGTGHDRWLELLDEMALPAIRAHHPDIVLVSAGFDAHARDPLAGLRLESRTYARVAERVRNLTGELGAAGSVWVLEGGYDLEALSESVAATLHVLRVP